jgi:hypothetical protein
MRYALRHSDIKIPSAASFPEILALFERGAEEESSLRDRVSVSGQGAEQNGFV